MVVMAGAAMVVKVAHVRLCRSRMMFVRAYLLALVFAHLPHRPAEGSNTAASASARLAAHAVPLL
jgi:hypothetical protein